LSTPSSAEFVDGYPGRAGAGPSSRFYGACAGERLLPDD